MLPKTKAIIYYYVELNIIFKFHKILENIRFLSLVQKEVIIREITKRKENEKILISDRVVMFLDSTLLVLLLH